MDNLRSGGLSGLCSFCSSFGDISRETTKSFPTVSMSLILIIHSWKPCSVHDSICGLDENGAGSDVMSKIPSSIQHLLHSTCNCSCHRWAVVDRFSQLCNELLPRERPTSAVKPSLPILKKLIASDAIVGIHFKMEWDSTIFSACASIANFSVRVCLFTSSMAGSATPFVVCSPTRSFTQNQFNKWGCQQSHSLESYDRWISIILQYHSVMPKTAQQ